MSKYGANLYLVVLKSVCVHVRDFSSAESLLHLLPTLWLEVPSCTARELVELR